MNANAAKERVSGFEIRVEVVEELATDWETFGKFGVSGFEFRVFKVQRRVWRREVPSSKFKVWDPPSQAMEDRLGMRSPPPYFGGYEPSIEHRTLFSPATELLH
jgi:hypothetical protein